jgi:predicted ATPase
MPITFRVKSRNKFPRVANEHVDKRENTALLVIDTWDDFSFRTSFELVVFDGHAHRHDIGTVKIGYVGQKEGWTKDDIAHTFNALPSSWFSLGQDVDYYENIRQKLSDRLADALLRALRDLAFDERRLTQLAKEPVLTKSLMRSVSLSVVQGQYKRVLSGEVVRVDFRFLYRDSGNSKRAPFNLKFCVETASTPSTNIHVLIGRNGVGKTTLLNNMVGALMAPAVARESTGHFFELNERGEEKPLPANYFSSVVSVSFSAFDPFIPPVDQPNRAQGIAYVYVGMKKARSGGTPIELAQPHKGDADLTNDFLDALRSCLSTPIKRERWRAMIERLESDENFADMELRRILSLERVDTAVQFAHSITRRMSSGHSIVLLTITKLVDAVEEKSLVLVDEPESHLHPPLLSAFTRALSDLLRSRNGVAIIATHSPVVAQEVPRTCVWKLNRLRAEGRADRPERETFGENVGVLTREVFGLEVKKSGFHEMLERAVAVGGTFESIYAKYNGQLGFEAQAIVRSLITARDSSSASN